MMDLLADRDRRDKKRKEEQFKCGHCNKVYKREKSLLTHKCEPKRRLQIKDTKEMKVALDIWLRFRAHARVPISKKLTPYEAFINSKEFTGFEKFAHYLIEYDILEVERFVDKLLHDSVPIDRWTSVEVRKAWTKHVLFREHPDVGIRRSIQFVQQWAEKTGHDWRDFFKEVSTQRALMWIENGQISPWFIHAGSTRNALIDRFDVEELTVAFEYIDPQVWGPKKVKYKADYEGICQVFEANGL